MNEGRHAKIINDTQEIINFSLMASESLQLAEGQMEDRIYCNMAAGVFGLIAGALSRAGDILSGLEADMPQGW